MAKPSIHDPPLPSKVAHQFAMPTWIENLAVRLNGQILVTLITTPELHLVDPGDSSRTCLIHKFQELNGLSGIIEVEHDIFYVVGGKFDLQTFTTEAGSFELWKVDMTNFDEVSAAVEKVMDLTTMRLPNGMALLSKSDRTILAADSEVGAIFKIDIEGKQHKILVDADETKNAENPHVPIAANGVKLHEGHVYWSNTSKALFCRTKITESGEAAENVEVLEQNFICDDFCIDTRGDVWFTQNPLNTLGVRRSQGGIVTVAGSIDQLTVAGCTACHFDRKGGNEHILYVVTSGALGSPVNGTQMEGGKWCL
jgi:sugar lactone lactonase YvrE